MEQHPVRRVRDGLGPHPDPGAVGRLQHPGQRAVLDDLGPQRREQVHPALAQHGDGAAVGQHHVRTEDRDRRRAPPGGLLEGEEQPAVAVAGGLDDPLLDVPGGTRQQRREQRVGTPAGDRDVEDALGTAAQRVPDRVTEAADALEPGQEVLLAVDRDAAAGLGGRADPVGPQHLLVGGRPDHQADVVEGRVEGAVVAPDVEDPAVPVGELHRERLTGELGSQRPQHRLRGDREPADPVDLRDLRPVDAVGVDARQPRTPPGRGDVLAHAPRGGSADGSVETHGAHLP
nr:hypothetical protein [Pseudonocardia sp. AL041005-10]